MGKNKFLSKMKPAVSKYWLMALAGFMWSVVGIMLCRLAFIRLSPLNWHTSLPMSLSGIVSSLAAYRFGFSAIAKKNINRLCLIADKSCIFAFQAWKSYLIIAFMITLGIMLRRSHFPAPFLAVIYITIGGALFLSSFLFYERIWRVKIKKRPCIHPEK